MLKLLSFLTSALLFATTANASVLNTTTSPDAAAVPTYGTFHDRDSGFVFVHLPTHWAFVAADTGAASHEVFHDAATGFVFVKLSTGWVFVEQRAPEMFAAK
jgi:hypothetical protein